MKSLSNIAALSVLLVSAVTFNPAIASADSSLILVQAQSNTQIINGNSASQRSGGASNTFKAGRVGTKRVCCTNYDHVNKYSGCATFHADQCPNYARFTPAPE
jgi:hypothetical protein